MSLEVILNRSMAAWMDGSGPNGDTVVSSRVRLARNLADYPFPHRMDSAQAREALDLMRNVVVAINQRANVGRLELYEMDPMNALDRQVLVEKHLISPQHADSRGATGVILRDDESIAVMVNEEDHLRIQCLASGFDLDKCFKMANLVDDEFEAEVAYAYCHRRGYLTACPTNVGSAMRASVMMHLPALLLTGQAGRIFSAITKVGILVRGLYGEGSEAIGNLFQVSNQISLGQGEAEIIDNLKNVATQIIAEERSAREYLLNNTKRHLEDRVSRAYGILSNARVISSSEAIRLWSDVKIGLELEILEKTNRRTLNELLVLTRPAFIQRLTGRELSPAERDERRAALIRDRLR
jgi:protein arginine kinase